MILQLEKDPSCLCIRVLQAPAWGPAWERELSIDPFWFLANYLFSKTQDPGCYSWDAIYKHNCHVQLPWVTARRGHHRGRTSQSSNKLKQDTENSCPRNKMRDLSMTSPELHIFPLATGLCFAVSASFSCI